MRFVTGRSAFALTAASMAALIATAPVGSNPPPASPPANPSIAWAASWGVADQRQDGSAPWTTIRLPGRDLSNQTVRIIARTSAGGSSVRLRLANAEGVTPVSLGHITVALRGTRAALVAGTVIDVTFAGRGHLTLLPGQSAVSDPVLLPVTPGSDLAVSMHVLSAHGPYSGHWAAKRTSYVSAAGSGDLTWGLTDAGFDFPTTSSLWLRGIDVMAQGPVVVAIGDSLTDGHVVAPDSNADWPSVLAARLGGGAAVINSGLNANTLTRLPCGFCGMPVLNRLERDALDLAGATHVVVLAGTNDLGRGVSAAGVAEGLTEAAKRIKARKMVAIVGTIPPRNDTGVGWDPDLDEKQRQQLNAWIRTQRVFDAMVDFDAVIRDPARPSWLLPRFDSGDHVHPSAAGMAAMANAVDLKTITG